MQMNSLHQSPIPTLTNRLPLTPEASEESRLLEMVGKGCRASFDELHRRMHTLLFSTSMGVLNSREAAEDVVQDVFVQIWERAASYDATRGKASTWLITLVRNKSIDRLRATQRRARLNSEFEEQGKTEVRFDDRDSLADAQTAEQAVMIRNAISKLSADQQAAIQLAFFDDMPYPAVAQRLSVPLGTVKARIRRGMKKLKNLLTPEKVG
jgi:RNA polymerase sigma-70 factor, ECF subfamily